MSILDNNWLQNFYATQLGTTQNSMIPVGEAWKRYLDYSNPLMYQAMNNMGLGGTMLWGQNGIPGLTDSLAQYQQQLPGMFGGMVGSTDPANNTIQAMMKYMAMGQDPYQTSLDYFKNGSQQGNDLLDYGMGMFSNPFNETMGHIGNHMLGNYGATPFNTDANSIANWGIKQGGWTPQLGQGFDSIMNQLVNTGGMTPGLQQGFGLGNSLVGAGQGGIDSGFGAMNGANSIFGGAANTGNQLVGSGMGMFGQGNNWSNPALQQGSQSALGMLGQNGQTPFLQNGQNLVSQVAQNGSMPQLDAAQQFFAGQMGTGGYGQMQSGFDFANKLMQGGGISPYTNQGAETALQYALGNGPNFLEGLGMSLPNFNVSGGGGFQAAGDVSAGPVDSGYNDSINNVIQKAQEILKDNPVMPMNQAVSIARNQAATATQQQYQAMMSRALARGNGAGSNVSSGLQNQGMADMADAGSKAESQAMQNAAIQQQQLGLQRMGIGSDLAKAMEQVAAQRNSTSAGLAGQIASANAGIHAANANASASTSNAQLAANTAMAQAQANLFGQLAGLKAQQGLGGLNALGNFSNQANQQMLAGLNSLPGMQQVANQRYGMDSDNFLKSTQMQSDRQMGALGMMPGFAEQQNKNMNTGFQGLIGLQGIQTQGQGDRLRAGNDMVGHGITSTLGGGQGMAGTGNTMSNIGLGQQGLGTGLINNSNNLGSQNLLGGLGMIPNLQNSANSNLGTWGNIGSNASNNMLGFMGLGAQLSDNNVKNTNSLLPVLGSIQNNNNNFKLGAGQLNNDFYKYGGTQLQNIFGNQLGLNKFGLDAFGTLNNAFGQNFDRQAANNTLLASIIANSYGPMTSLAGGMQNYLTNAMSGYAGIKPQTQMNPLAQMLTDMIKQGPNPALLPNRNGGGDGGGWGDSGSSGSGYGNNLPQTYTNRPTGGYTPPANPGPMPVPGGSNVNSTVTYPGGGNGQPIQYPTSISGFPQHTGQQPGVEAGGSYGNTGSALYPGGISVGSGPSQAELEYLNWLLYGGQGGYGNSSYGGGGGSSTGAYNGGSTDLDLYNFLSQMGM